MHRRLLLLPAIVLLTSCAVTETSRVTTTLRTGTCSWNGKEYLGVADFRVSLEYTPTSLADRSLPAPGTCSNRVFLYPEESNVVGGADIPKLDGEPAWSATRDAGSLSQTEPGLWFDDVYAHAAGGCGTVDEVAKDGVTLDDAGLFSGVSTPPTSSLGLVKVDGVRDDRWTGEVGYGNPMDLSWEGSEWEETFVQVRQFNGPNLRDVVTCNTTGTSSLSLDGQFWGTVSNMGAERVEVLVSFQNTTVVDGASGEAIQAITRVAHVLESPEDSED